MAVIVLHFQRSYKYPYRISIALSTLWKVHCRAVTVAQSERESQTNVDLQADDKAGKFRKWKQLMLQTSLLHVYSRDTPFQHSRPI